MSTIRDRVFALTDAAARERFAYGRFDCVTFADTVYCAVTGRESPVKTHGWHWSNEAEMRALLAQLGGLEAALLLALGDSVSPMQCRIGDLVFARIGDAEVLCVHDGYQLVAPCERKGLRRVPRQFAVRGWRLPHAPT